MKTKSGHVPKFLELPVNEWPVEQNTDIVDIPDLKVKSHLATIGLHNVESLAARINPERFSKWVLLKFTTVRVLKLYRRFKASGPRDELKCCQKTLKGQRRFG